MAQISVRQLEKVFRVAERRAGFWGAVRSLGHRRYRDVRALHGVDFDIEQGELVGYIGPNGAGKSTTIKILSGILTPSGGECRVNGLSPWRDRVRHVARIGVVFGQRSQLWWDLPVVESFDLLRDIYGTPPKEHALAREELAELLNLEPLFDVPVRQLSLGQRARCDLAASLLHRPDILFLDEPTIGLDAPSRLAVREFIRRQNREYGITVLLTSHDMGDIEALCERVMVINDGTLLLDGPMSSLRSARQQERRVVVEFEDGETLSARHRSLAEGDGARVRFRVAENAPAFVAELSARYRIRDLIVEHPPIEEIVRDLYRSAAA